MPEREFRPGQDDAAVLSLRARVWGADHPHCIPAFYEWLFGRAPAGPGAGIVSEIDGRVVGFAGICRREARHGHVQLKVAHGLDFMVDPTLGKMLSGRVGLRVLLKHIGLAKRLGNDLNINFPNDNSHRMLISERIGYAPVFSARLLVRPLGPLRPERGAAITPARRALAILGGCAAAGAGAARAALARPAAARIERLERFDARFDEFWERLAADGRLHFARDARTLNWRYAEHPLHSYEILAASEGGRILGYVVAARREVLGIDAVLICDLCVLPGRSGIHAALLGPLVGRARRQGAAALVAQCAEGDPLGRALARCGFFHVPARLNPKPFRMVGMAFGGGTSAALAPSSWAFRWGDTDVV